MKNAFIILLIMFSLSVSSVAQNPAYPYGLSFKALFMDYQSQNGGSIADFGSYHHGFEIGFHKQLQENINLVVPFKAGVVSSSSKEGAFTHRTVYGLDAQVQYLFYKPETVVTPYVMAGLGAVNEVDGDFNMQIPVGVGLHFKVADNAYINWQSEFRYALKEDRNNLQHGLGFVYLFGTPSEVMLPDEEEEDKAMMDEKTEEEEMNNEEEEGNASNEMELKPTPNDVDGDGLENDIDLCPDEPGTKELKGCPDSDNDGVPDYRDQCPNTSGLSVFKGCPDSDGDGISDTNDECPNRAGTSANNGCPEDSADSDDDGVSDENDLCPNEKGSVETNGCPDDDGDGIANAEDKCPNKAGLRVLNGCPDSDGDGLDDSRDKCPNSPGSVATDGCPEISEEDLSVLDLAMRAVSFDTGKSTLKPESYPILNQIANIAQKYENYNLLIEGHTDNVGNATNNQLLSERRAQACYEYLIQKGISSDRMSFVGFGESRPINSNESLRGRSLNRRVQFTLKPR